MKKILFIFVFGVVQLFFIISQEFSYKVVEKKGAVDIKVRSGKWAAVEEGDVLITGTEIFTGLHSQISLEVAEGSYVTVDQLSHMVIDRVRVKKNEVVTELNLLNGYLVVYSRKSKELKNKILINFLQGNIQFENSGGEIYLRKEVGVVVKSFKGKVSLRTKGGDRYFIRKNEVCGISVKGRLIESDYFLKSAINTIPLEYQGETEVYHYYNQLLNYYTIDKNTTDYGDAFGAE